RDHRRNDPMSPAPLDLTPTVAYLRERMTRPPRVLLVLGSGQGEAAADIQDPVRIPYAEIPGFAAATVHGHAGMLIAGTLEGVECLVMQGRYHLYEGQDRKSTRLNSSHVKISYAVFCLKKKKKALAQEE